MSFKESVIVSVGGLCLGLALASMMNLMGCCQSPQSIAGKPDQQIITITVRNDTDAMFYGSVSAGVMSKSVEVPPHESRSFWGYKSMVPDSVQFTVTDQPKPRVRK